MNHSSFSRLLVIIGSFLFPLFLCFFPCFSIFFYFFLVPFSFLFFLLSCIFTNYLSLVLSFFSLFHCSFGLFVCFTDSVFLFINYSLSVPPLPFFLLFYSLSSLLIFLLFFNQLPIPDSFSSPLSFFFNLF